VLIGDPLAISFSDSVGLSRQSPCFTGDLKRSLLRADVILRDDIIVKAAARVDVRMSDGDLFDFLKLEQPLAIFHRVERFDSERRFRENRTCVDRIVA
jgi:hypothetical protein